MVLRCATFDPSPPWAATDRGPLYPTHSRFYSLPSAGARKSWGPVDL